MIAEVVRLELALSSVPVALVLGAGVVVVAVVVRRAAGGFGASVTAGSHERPQRDKRNGQGESMQPLHDSFLSYSGVKDRRQETGGQ